MRSVHRSCGRLSRNVSAMKVIIGDLSLKPCQLFLGSFLIFVSQTVFAAGEPCGGCSTLLYANDNLIFTICHGPYTKIDIKRLDQWQNCDDAEIQIRYKKNGNTTQYADCLSEAGKQFRIRGSEFMLKHFQTTYPGFESEPLLVEILNLETNKKTYQFEKQFQACSRKDIDQAVKQVESAIAKPFKGGQTYFNLVYGGFYRLRGCAKSDPQLVLSILRKYQNSGYFDGEVAETLSSVTSDAEVIYEAIKR
jgi:hypothetical protein